MLTQYIDIVVTAPMRALATHGSCGLNVVPVSVVTTLDTDIILYDFFMDKTIKNIQSSSQVSLVAWDGLSGIQLKGNAEYLQSGDAFVAATKSMQQRFPERTLRGIVRFTPTTVYSVSAGPEAGRLLV